MKLIVMSPSYRAGTTIATILIGHACAYTQELSTVITYAGSQRILPKYLGFLEEIQDETRSITQVAKLIEANAIEPRELYDYALRVDVNLHVMDTVSTLVTEQESSAIQSYVLSEIPCDLSICDVNGEIYAPTTQKLFAEADAVCMVVEPDMESIQRLREWMESEYWPKEKNIFYIFNKYNEDIAALRVLAKELNLKFRDVCKLHYNPFITRMCNTGQALDLVPGIYKKDMRVLTLRHDLREIIGWITSNMDRKIVWEG